MRTRVWKVMTLLALLADVCGDNKGFMRLRYKEYAGNALAPDADERRSKLRKAVGRSKHPLIHRSLNGETLMR